MPVDDKAEKELKKGTLTNLYNARPAWLAHAHANLDATVADAYGWGDDWRAGLLTDDEILTRLFRLNQDRAAAQGGWGAMCGRFIDPNLRGTELELSQIKIDPFTRRFNIKPTQDVIVVPSDPAKAALARWWLVPSWHKGDLRDWKATTFNARIEDAATKPTFRAVWKHGRCLIPAGGYYEWTGDKGAKQPHAILSAGN
ncbi:SOS response-associated peptidase family protein [Paracoccus sp. SCN 68-21]|nr:SOS response-associated peptidase family protein [Paracoccus sp. SCN 68-21]